jgi:TolC family type I secretion outer membrane protein
MISLASRILASLAVAALLVPASATAQPTAADPMAPRVPLTAPSALRAFPTPAEIATRELTLGEAVRIALDNAPVIIQRFAEYAAAQQRIDQAFSAMLPQLSLLGQVTRIDSSSRVWSGGGSFNNSSVTSAAPGSGRLSLSQMLFDFGRTWAATDAAKANSDTAREQVELQKDLIVVTVKEFYFLQLLSSRLVVVAAQAVDRAELNLKSAKGFYDVGTRPKFDVTRAEVDVANARVALIRAQNAVSLARIGLNQSMGIAINAPTRIKDILAYEPVPFDRETLVSEALKQRPEYKQAKLRADAAEATVRQNFRDFFPNLFGVSSVGAGRVDSDFRGFGSTPLGNSTSEAKDWQIGLELRWNIFDGGNKIARYREAKALMEASQAGVRDTELQVWQQVEQAHVNVVESEERIGAAQKAVESAQENFRLSQGRFDAGVGTIIELTDAQLALTQAQATEAQALSDYKIAIARLERSLGRR